MSNGHRVVPRSTAGFDPIAEALVQTEYLGTSKNRLNSKAALSKENDLLKAQ
jgi:hypothetical protein